MEIDWKELHQRLTDAGKIIEAGWIGYRFNVLPPDAPAIQVEETHMAFFAGAQHLFSSIMCILEPDAEPTEKDLMRMSAISNELDSFLAQFKAKHGIALDS